MEKIPEVKVHLADLKALYNAGYEVLTKLRKEANSPVVEAHFLNQEIIAIYGRNAAKIFYDKRFFKRSNAMPKPILRTLQGEGGIQTLDGEAHHKRKKIFMDLMTPERLDDYKRLLEKNLITALNKQQETFELYALTKDVLFKTICSWAGINLENYSRDKITELEDDQVAMFEGTVTSIPDHINGLTGRKNAEEWAQELIKNAREAPLETDKNLALYAFSTATDEKWM